MTVWVEGLGIRTHSEFQGATALRVPLGGLRLPSQSKSCHSSKSTASRR
jgi:hypothetical protein